MNGVDSSPLGVPSDDLVIENVPLTYFVGSASSFVSASVESVRSMKTTVLGS